MDPPGDPLSHLSAEHQLELVRRLIDATVDAILAHAPGGQLIFYNRSACELLGMSYDEMGGLGAYGWVAPDNLRGAADRLEHILYDRQLVFDSAILRADGTTVPTEVTARRVDTDVGPLIVAVIRDVRDRNAAREKLEHLAYHDGLTGLANRAALDARLALAIADARRYGDLLVLAYIDLDKFKPVNDRYGHESGDLMLVELGKRLTSCIRTQDLVARLGGDEFVIVLERSNSVDELPDIAQRLLDAIRKPMEACGEECRIDASIGFAVFDPAEDDARSLLVKADVAMYEAKRHPDNPWVIYSSSIGSDPETGT